MWTHCGHRCQKFRAVVQKCFITYGVQHGNGWDIKKHNRTE
jgi:hypothetical protein